MKEFSAAAAKTNHNAQSNDIHKLGASSSIAALKGPGQAYGLQQMGAFVNQSDLTPPVEQTAQSAAEENSSSCVMPMSSSGASNHAMILDEDNNARRRNVDDEVELLEEEFHVAASS